MNKKDLIAASIPVLELIHSLLCSFIQTVDKFRGDLPGLQKRPLTPREVLAHLRSMDHWL